jgi:hypothetical protein
MSSQHAAALYSGPEEVKIKREHVQGSADSNEIKPQVEPITEETVRMMSNPNAVEVCQSSSFSDTTANPRKES